MRVRNVCGSGTKGVGGGIEAEGTRWWRWRVESRGWRREGMRKDGREWSF